MVNSHVKLALLSNMTSRQAYLDSHPSLNASMDDYEVREFSPTMPDLPSQHSGFRSNHSDYSERSSSRRSYSPPTWRKAGSGWFKHHTPLSPQSPTFASTSASPSAEAEGDGDVSAYRRATRIPLPASPIKGRTPSISPEPNADVGANEGDGGGGDDTVTAEHDEAEGESPEMRTPTQSNCKFTCWHSDMSHGTDSV